MIDEAELRRGQLSVQKKFGREMAVYAGDFMIFSEILMDGLCRIHICRNEIHQVIPQLERKPQTFREVFGCLSFGFITLSVQKKFGREMAVYAGDFMIFSAISCTSLVNKPWYRELFGNLDG